MLSRDKNVKRTSSCSFCDLDNSCKSLIFKRASDGIRTRDLSITNQEELKPFRLAMNRGQLGDTVGLLDFCDGDWDREG